jgi:hypothetical protein
VESGSGGLWRDEMPDASLSGRTHPFVAVGLVRLVAVPDGSRTERGGFEPPMGFDPHNGLANRRFRPLSHLSRCITANWKKTASVGWGKDTRRDR